LVCIATHENSPSLKVVWIVKKYRLAGMLLKRVSEQML
jgi:hypothetical protein